MFPWIVHRISPTTLYNLWNWISTRQVDDKTHIYLRCCPVLSCLLVPSHPIPMIDNNGKCNQLYSCKNCNQSIGASEAQFPSCPTSWLSSSILFICIVYPPAINRWPLMDVLIILQGTIIIIINICTSFHLVRGWSYLVGKWVDIGTVQVGTSSKYNDRRVRKTGSAVASSITLLAVWTHLKINCR